MSEYITVAKVGSIPAGQGETFTVEDRLVAVFYDGENYFAIDDLCPHMGASLAGGAIAEGEVTCPWHAWRFRLSDGTWCDNTRLKVDCFDLRIQGDEIQVCATPRKKEPDRKKDSPTGNGCQDSSCSQQE